MFKELICAVAISGTIGMTAPQNSNDGTYYQDVTITETYEYETNEVNSVDDLVVGNIYKFTYDVSAQSGSAYLIYVNYINYTENGLNQKSLDDTPFRIHLGGAVGQRYITAYYGNGDTLFRWYIVNQNTLQCYIVFSSIDDTSRVTYENFSASDYLGEKTITITPKEFNGLFSIFDNFLHERLFSGGILDTTNITVFNATMSLGQWLSTTTSMILLCLIVLLLVLLIKFIFKYVGGMMIWRS